MHTLQPESQVEPAQLIRKPREGRDDKRQGREAEKRNRVISGVGGIIIEDQSNGIDEDMIKDNMCSPGWV